MSPVSFILHTGHGSPECWFLVGFSRLCETLVVWHFQVISVYKKKWQNREIWQGQISTLLQDISLSSLHDGGSFLLCKSVEGSGELHEPQDSATSQHPAEHLFSLVVCRHPKAARKTCHAQTSCAHPPTLGQAGLRARADHQLLTRELVVVLLESCKFWERTELVPAPRAVSPEHR